MTNNIVKANTRKSTSLIKKYLQEKYNVKCKVRTDKYSMGSSLNIEYDLGPSPKNIELEMDRLQYGRFNSYEDIYEHKNNAETKFILNGYEIECQKYVFVKRNISNEFKFRLAKAISDKFSFANFFKLETIDQLHTYFINNDFGINTWSQFLYQRGLQNVNFITQDESEIEDIECFRNENVMISSEYYFTYRVNNQTYDSRNFKISETRKIRKEKTIVANDIKLIDYSDKAIAVIGNTFEIKEQLKKAGGRFNRHLTIEGNKVAGWIFRKAKTNEVSNVLITYSKE